jgi:hypothetical protein
MRTLTAVVLGGALLALPACAQQKGKLLLTDAELDKVSAGTDLCALFGINGPCVGSYLQVFDPALAPNPSCGTLPGANTNCASLLSSSPLPPSGSVTLEQSFRVGGAFSFQSVSQTNTASTIGSQQPLKYYCFTCWQPLDVFRTLGH